MQYTTVGRWALHGILGAVLSASVIPAPLSAQTTCPCAETRAFGSCIVKRANYPNEYPGAVAVARIEDQTVLFVADLFNGFTYRFNARTFEAQVSAPPLVFPSPQGSNATTGIAVIQRLEESVLFWAVEGDLYRTDLAGGNPIRTGTVQMAELARQLREILADPTISTGSLGGITYHASRDTLWGVDIVNDVYFEFTRTGQLSLDGEGKPVHFLSPLRNPAGGGAYGNSITYVVSGGEEYFDLPVGSLRDGTPSEVVRVHATAGAEPGGPRIGDDTGISYELGAALGSPKFVTGIAFWADSCASGQASEFILDLDQLGGTPRIIEVSADHPTAASVAAFATAIAGEATVKVTWRKTLPYTSLKITRAPVGATTEPQVIYENTDFASDPGEFEDENIPDGSYQYAATVTAATGALPPRTSAITVGNGERVAFTRFSLPNVASPAPYAVAVTTDRVIVADINDGQARVYDLDLAPVAIIDRPLASGQTTGIAYGQFLNVNGVLEERLYWLSLFEGRFFLTPTNMQGQQIAAAQPVFAPKNLKAGMLLGDLSYDAENDFFWTADIFNLAFYALKRDGSIADPFATRQTPTPEAGGFLSGAMSVAATSDEATSLDFIVGKTASGTADQLARYEYLSPDFAGPGMELFRIDLKTATGAADFGGVALHGGESESFAYVVAQDTKTVYKLRITGPTEGGTLFRRGDANNDNQVNISDPSFILEFLFRLGPAPSCRTAADANDSDSIEVTDAIYLFSYLFQGGPAPPPPFASCGIDAQGTLTCEAALCTN